MVSLLNVHRLASVAGVKPTPQATGRSQCRGGGGGGGGHIEGADGLLVERARVLLGRRLAVHRLVLRPGPRRELPDALERVDVLVVGVLVAEQLEDQLEAHHLAQLEIGVVDVCAPGRGLWA